MTIRRINSGSGHRYEDDGRALDGVTTLIGAGLPKPALTWWAAGTTANYAVDHWDELSARPLSERLNTLTKAHRQVRDRAANRGTEVHRLAVQLVRGDEVEIPPELEGHVLAYVKFLDEWQPEPILVEATVVNRDVGYAGTLDLLATFPPDPAVAICDVKTGAGVYGDAGLQLAAYAYAQKYLDADGQEQPMPHVDVARVVHVRSDGYEVYPFPLDAGVFSAFRHVAWVARKMPAMKDWKGAPLRRPVVTS
jgi:hypothetical protein